MINTDPLFYGFADSPFGEVLIVCDQHALYRCDFARSDALPSNWQPHPDLARHYATQLGQAAFEVTLHPVGTPFQQRVWQALQQIPFGQTRSYSQIAEAIEQPNAVRAVASAIARNPISWFIPCHRVIRADGTLGGYAWGIERKHAMLSWEKHERS